MYWNNPVITATANSEVDPIELAQHQGQHCLFYDPAVPLNQITKLITLQDTCDVANRWLGQFDKVDDSGDLDKIANIVRINQFVHSLRKQGNLKPMLLYYTGSWPVGASTGGSRVMAAERIAGLETFSAFVSTHVQHRSEFSHLAEIKTIKEFASLFDADDHTQFLFRLTDPNAGYGIDWYEAALSTTQVPNNSQCMQWLQAYVQQQNKDFRFEPQWFDQLINWTVFTHH